MKITIIILLAFSLALGPVVPPLVHAQSSDPFGSLASGVAAGAASCFAGYIAGVASSAISGFLSGAGSSVAGSAAGAAGGGVAAGGGYPVIDIAAVTALHTGNITASLERGTLIGTNTNLLVKECVIDPLIASIVQLLREQVLQRIFRYIGGEDSPAFIQRFASRLQNVGRRAADDQLKEVVHAVNDAWEEDIEREVRVALSLSYEARIGNTTTSCYGEDGQPDGGAYFHSGTDYLGAGGYRCAFAVAADPWARTPLLNYYLVLEAASHAQRAAEDEERFKYLANEGYKPQQECEEVPVITISGAYTGETVEECKDVTPGSNVADLSKKAVGAPLDQLNSADEIGEIIRLLVLDIINYALGIGLSEVNNAIGGAASYTSQLGDAEAINGGVLIESGAVTGGSSTFQVTAEGMLLTSRATIQNYISTLQETLQILNQALALVDTTNEESDYFRLQVLNTIALTEANIQMAQEVLLEIQSLEQQLAQSSDPNDAGTILFRINQLMLLRRIDPSVAEAQKANAEVILAQAQQAAGVPATGSGGTSSGGSTGGGVSSPGSGSSGGGNDFGSGIDTSGNGSGAATALWSIPMGQSFATIANSTWWDARTANLRYPDNQTVRVQFDPSSQNTRGGVHGFFRIPSEYTENGQRACLSYDVFLQDGFPHADPSDNSCKLPGLAGGEIQYAGGGRLSDDKRAFSTRLGISSWYTREYVVTPYFYLRWSKQPASNGIVPSFGIYGYGQDAPMGTVNEISNQYTNITQCVTLNTNDQPNGEIQVWVDGTLRHENEDVYITDGSFDIDYVFMSHFCNQPIPNGTYTDYKDMFILDPDDLFDGNGEPLRIINV